MEHFTFTKPGGKWNEDRVYSCDDFAFVLDGATCLTGEHFTNYNSDAEWYSNWWCEYLKTELKNTEKTIPEILKLGIGKVTKEFKKFAGKNKIKDYPSSTVSIVRRLENGLLEIYSLTDSSILVLSKTGIFEVIQEQSNHVKDAFTVMKLHSLAQSENITLMQSNKKYKQIVADARQNKNKFAPSGYFVLADSEEAIEHGIYSNIDESLIDKILILSDGYSRVYDVVKFMSAEKLIRKINNLKDVEKIYNKLKKLQEKDSLAKKHFRFKVSDDASLAYMKF